MKNVTLPDGRTLDFSQGPLIMGILNVTPDSFSDGGHFLDPDRAVAHGERLAADGAAILDIGGESTRPGSQPVDADEQIRRTVPVIERLRRWVNIPISIDTTSSKVAQAALDAGAAILNDISALRFDPQMASLAADAKVPVILMHMQGTPGNMQQNPHYDNVVDEVKSFLAERITAAVKAGIDRIRTIIDPGIGFGKTVEHNLMLLGRIGEFHDLGVPILVGPSRKAFIGKILGIDDPNERLFGTAAAVAWCATKRVQILRVHDVLEMSQAARLATAITQMQTQQK
ncbi:MAG: dihydropteroate synthase [Sedimentisphaerales bacterium]|nr:dihydropteroate synthase [Sedimentisphaerales bacterium]